MEKERSNDDDDGGGDDEKGDDSSGISSKCRGGTAGDVRLGARPGSLRSLIEFCRLGVARERASKGVREKEREKEKERERQSEIERERSRARRSGSEYGVCFGARYRPAAGYHCPP